MKKLLLGLFLLFSLPLQTSFALNTNSQDATPIGEQNRETLQWLIVLNKSEIDVANVVLKRQPLNPQVKGFAEFMISQHTQLLNDTNNLIKHIKAQPLNEGPAADLQKQGDQALKELSALDAKEIQKPYMDAMVQGHTEALAALQKYIASENNPSIKKLLAVTEHHVKMHLEKATAIKKNLKF